MSLVAPHLCHPTNQEDSGRWVPVPVLFLRKMKNDLCKDVHTFFFMKKNINTTRLNKAFFFFFFRVR